MDGSGLILVSDVMYVERGELMMEPTPTSTLRTCRAYLASRRVDSPRLQNAEKSLMMRDDRCGDNCRFGLPSR